MRGEDTEGTRTRTKRSQRAQGRRPRTSHGNRKTCARNAHDIMTAQGFGAQRAAHQGQELKQAVGGDKAIDVDYSARW